MEHLGRCYTNIYDYRIYYLLNAISSLLFLKKLKKDIFAYYKLKFGNSYSQIRT